MGASIDAVSDPSWFKRVHRAVYYSRWATNVRAFVRKLMGPTDPKP